MFRFKKVVLFLNVKQTFKTSESIKNLLYLTITVVKPKQSVTLISYNHCKAALKQSV